MVSRLRQLLSFAWLNVYPLLALAFGVLLLTAVPQMWDVLGQLGDIELALSETRLIRWSQLVCFLVAVGGWGAAIWYSMRVLTSTLGRGEAGARSQPDAWMRALHVHAPRMCGFLALCVATCITPMFMVADATPWHAICAAAGIVIARLCLFEALDRLPIWRADAHSRSRPDYAVLTAIFAIAVAALAAVVWSRALPDTPAAWYGYQVYSCEPEADCGWRWPDGFATRGQAASMLAAFVVTGAAHFVKRAPMRIALQVMAVVLWFLALPRIASPVAAYASGVLILYAVAALWWASRRRDIGLLRFRVTDPGVPSAHVESATWGTLWTTIILLGVFIAWASISPITLGRAAGSMGLIFLAFSLWCFFGAFLWVFLFRRWGLGSWAIVPFAWLLLFGTEADHRLRGVRLPQAAVPVPYVREHFAAWQQRLPDPNESPIFLVAAAGGGLRAAYWTGTLLAAMDDWSCGEFGRHVYMLSGVSGGSLGMSAYAAQRRLWEARRPADLAQDKCPQGRVQEMHALLARDFLSPVSASLLFAEAFQAFVPRQYLTQDRGSTLADAWSDAWNQVFARDGMGALDKPFLEVFGAMSGNGRDARGDVPAIFLNATSVDTGRRVIATNVRAPIAEADPLFWRAGSTWLETEGLPVSEAVLNSARFTYVSPAGTVYGCLEDAVDGATGAQPDPRCSGAPYRVWARLVDGGYFENSGADTVMDVLQRLDLSESIRNRVFLIVIDNDGGSDPACKGEWFKPGEGVASGVSRLAEAISSHAQGIAVARGTIPPGSDLSAPVATMLKVREARAELAIRRARAALTCYRLLEWRLSSLQSAEYAGRRDPPLGWMLSAGSVRSMIAGLPSYVNDFPFLLAGCADRGVRILSTIGRRQLNPPSCVRNVWQPAHRGP